MRLIFALVVCSIGLLAQPPDPEIAGIFTRIGKQTARLTPMLEQVHVQEWVSKGASDTYVSQLNSIQAQVRAIQTEMDGLAQHPEKMQECMKGLFRAQALHGALESLMVGLRRYQNAPLADLIESVAAEDQGDLQKLQNYILDLANQKEQEFLVVDHEAQRCRATLSRDPVPTKKK